jgi:hypothetical protein
MEREKEVFRAPPQQLAASGSRRCLDPVIASEYLGHTAGMLDADVRSGRAGTRGDTRVTGTTWRKRCIRETPKVPIMTKNEADVRPMEEPLAELERELISAYLVGAGQDPKALMARDDPEARQILVDASLYACSRLTEVESRLHYLRSLRGQE